MVNDRTKNPRLAIAVIMVAAMLLATTAISMSPAQNVFAGKNGKNQATSQPNACGNEFMPLNVGCQNTGSQIQGDENSVALTAQQTFPSVTPTPTPTPPPEETCEECFTEVLTADEQAEFLSLVGKAFPEDFPTTPTFEELCDAIQTVNAINNLEILLGPGVPELGLPGLELEEDRIAEIVECLHRVFGF